MSPKTIITYLTDGTPLGIKTVQFSNRLIIGISIPRKDFEKSKKLKELERSGIYFLLGEDESGNPLAYIGQATVLGKRLNDHYKDTKKDFWNVAIGFTTRDGTFNESDINYLEKELIREAEGVNRYVIKNGNSGNNGLIQEYRIPDMIEYIEDLKILLLSLGFPLLESIVDKKNIENNGIYFLKERNSNATGVYTYEGFVVLKGSIGPIQMQKSVIEKGFYAFRNRPKLVEGGVIEEKGENIVFLQDYLFTSPSSACDFITGGSYNGWDVWKTKTGKTLDEIERKNK